MAYTKSERPEGPARRRGGMHARRRKVCVFCGKDNVIDYKDANKLRKYISEGGKILPLSSVLVRWQSFLIPRIDPFFDQNKGIKRPDFISGLFLLLFVVIYSLFICVKSLDGLQLFIIII